VAGVVDGDAGDGVAGDGAGAGVDGVGAGLDGDAGGCVGTVVGAAGGVALGVTGRLPGASGTAVVVPPGGGAAGGVIPGEGIPGLAGAAVLPGPVAPKPPDESCALAAPAKPSTARLATNWTRLFNSIAPSVSKLSRPVVLEKGTHSRCRPWVPTVPIGHRPGRHKVSRWPAISRFSSRKTGVFV